ncbi:serine hydrolase domain-containing protein [Lutimaribacter marinistellae]|uniref:Serine hydrolase domain-containing protein n=1 Tax=Lutimaribacter marinistellae TaxID=1820329 RepID=A0ABV7THH0_9RHOB
MRTFGKWLGRLLLTLIAAAIVVGVWKREEIARLWAVNSLFSENKIVGNFSAMGDAFLTVPVSRGSGPVSELPNGAPYDLPADARNWLSERSVTSILVLDNGEIRYEKYLLGTAPEDLRISWSIAKSYLSVLFGILVEDGQIASLDDPVVKYAPDLKGSAYETASIRDVLQMSSGVTFDEDYHDPDSDINRMGRVVALGGTLDDFTASFQDSFAAPGETWQYVSIDTHVIGMVLRGATGRSIPDLLAEKVIAPLGLESDGYYLTDGAGTAFVLGGLNFRSRDYARFGQMVAQEGSYEGAQIVSADWLEESTAPSAATKPGRIGYGYQWWIPVDARPGEVLGRGVYGQYLYIDKERDIVIVLTAADRAFRADGVNEANIEMFRRIADSL